MKKQIWKPGNMVYPLPVVMVSCQLNSQKPNIITVAWTGTICTNPAKVYISVRPERYSYEIIKESKEFVINLTTKDLVRAVDYCGVVSGRQADKFREMGLTPEMAKEITAPLIRESPVNIECKVTEIIKLGSHDMFLADVVAVHADEQYMNSQGKFELAKANPIVYSHGEYYDLGNCLGSFGYSIRKKSRKPDKKTDKKYKRTKDKK